MHFCYSLLRAKPVPQQQIALEPRAAWPGIAQWDAGAWNSGN
jgi:hypothetical protein